MIESLGTMRSVLPTTFRSFQRLLKYLQVEWRRRRLTKYESELFTLVADDLLSWSNTPGRLLALFCLVKLSALGFNMNNGCPPSWQAYKNGGNSTLLTCSRDLWIGAGFSS